MSFTVVVDPDVKYLISISYILAAVNSCINDSIGIVLFMASNFVIRYSSLINYSNIIIAFKLEASISDELLPNSVSD